MIKFVLIYENETYAPIDDGLCKLNWVKLENFIRSGEDVGFYANDSKGVKHFLQPYIVKRCLIKYL